MDASFTPRGDLLVPSPSTAGPWSDEMVGGHHIGGLVAWGVERDNPEPDLQVSRLPIDMFRPVPMRPLRVLTRPARTGRRLRAVEVSVLDGEVEVTRGSALLLRRSEHPDGEPWTPEPWDAPDPDEVASLPIESEMSWEIRRVADWGVGRGKAWMRERAEFVAGQQLTPLLRAAVSADFAHPLANSGGTGLAFINADLTMYLARYPNGEWIGMEASGHVGTEGIAVGSAWLYDRPGRIGHVVVAAIPDPRIQQRHYSAPRPTAIDATRQMGVTD
jgi:hypothetical protein